MIAHAAGISLLLVHVKGSVVRWMNPELGSHNIEEHEEESRQAKGAGDRANSAAAVDTAGASMGSGIA
jgi:hypothetical protein